MRKTGLLLVLSCVWATAGEMRPFAMDHRRAASGGVDVSFLLDAPAGKRGFVRVSGGHLVDGAGKRLRLWGVNITDWSKGSTMLPPKEDAPVWAAALARYGVNCVRLHFLDLAAPRGLIDPGREDTASFDAVQLDRLDFWISELKKRGVYVNINLNVGRSYKAGDGVEAAEKIRWAKGLTMYNRRLIELQKQYAKDLLAHFNPYTGSEYRDEPAVATVELVNENALYVGFRTPTPAYEQELLDLYNAWVRENLAFDALAKLRSAAGVPDGRPVPRLTSREEITAAPKERFEAEAAFFIAMETRFFREMQQYLRELGVKALIVGTADHSHSGSSYALLSSTSLLDIVDGHSYWQHPGPGVRNTPMVNEPLESIVVRLSRSAFAGKPYTVSEVNHPFPSEYAAEGIPILAAYSAFQDWDGVFWYTFEPKVKDWKPSIGDAFDISLDPVKMPQLAAGALMFLRGDVRPARTVVRRSYTRRQVLESLRLPRAERPYFTPGFPLALPLRHASQIASLDGPPTQKFPPVDTNPIVSDTGELAWHVGLVTVDAERTQAQIGFVKERGQRLKHLAAEIDNRFAALILSALDGKPIARSGRMLLTAGSAAGNSGMEWDAKRSTLKQWGTAATVIEPVTGRIVLRNLGRASAATIVALDGAGGPAGARVPARKTTEGWEFPLGSEPTTWYLIEVPR